VSALGDFLEAMHDARRSLGPVRGTLREWRDERLVRWHGLDWPDEGAADRGYTGEDEFEQLIDFKLALPDRIRLEMRWPDAAPTSIVVCDGSRCGTWFSDWGTTVEDLDLGRVDWILGTAGRLLDPAWLLGLLEFDQLRQVTHRDGRAVRVRGRPRSPLPWPFGPADEHELVVGLERGTLYRLTGLLRSSEAFVHELVELERDVAFDDEAFVLPAGGEVSGLGLREAAHLADFPLWALPRPVLDVTYRPEPPESVTLVYTDWIVVLTSGFGEHGWLRHGEHEVVERDARTYWLTEREVSFAIDDTWISLMRLTTTGEDLIAVAETLMPVA
jgi:hypothetical protein